MAKALSHGFHAPGKIDEAMADPNDLKEQAEARGLLTAPWWEDDFVE